MNRKWMVWIVMPVLLTFLYGCPKKKPATPPSDLDVETTTVPSTPPIPPPAQDVQQPAQPRRWRTRPRIRCLSADMQVVNDELRRRGFSPDVYFDYDEAIAVRRHAGQAGAQRRPAQEPAAVLDDHRGPRRLARHQRVQPGPRRAARQRRHATTWARSASPATACAPSPTARSARSAPRSDESCWSQNRRAHMVITGRSNVG